MYLDRKDLPPQLRSLGNRIKVVLTPTVAMPADAGTWSGGTREVYSALELATGSVVSITDTFSAPWDARRQSREITLKPGYAILVTGSFCGKPAVPYLYCHPESAALALPPPPAPDDLATTLAKLAKDPSAIPPRTTQAGKDTAGPSAPSGRTTTAPPSATST